MGRMHSRGKGIAKSALPYKRTPPSWLKLSASDVEAHVCKLAKKGLTPSQVRSLIVITFCFSFPSSKPPHQSNKSDF